MRQSLCIALALVAAAMLVLSCPGDVRGFMVRGCQFAPCPVGGGRGQAGSCVMGLVEMCAGDRVGGLVDLRSVLCGLGVGAARASREDAASPRTGWAASCRPSTLHPPSPQRRRAGLGTHRLITTSGIRGAAFKVPPPRQKQQVLPIYMQRGSAPTHKKRVQSWNNAEGFTVHRTQLI